MSREERMEILLSAYGRTFEMNTDIGDDRVYCLIDVLFKLGI